MDSFILGNSKNPNTGLFKKRLEKFNLFKNKINYSFGCDLYCKVKSFLSDTESFALKFYRV